MIINTFPSLKSVRTSVQRRLFVTRFTLVTTNNHDFIFAPPAEQNTQAGDWGKCHRLKLWRKMESISLIRLVVEHNCRL
jgi:hypothetical protein